MIDRRTLCGSIIGLIGSLQFENLKPGVAKVLFHDQEEFLIVNGWVLTRKDVVGSKATSNAI